MLKRCLLVVLGFLGAGCSLLPTQPSDGFCCLTAESCAEVGALAGGGTPAVTPCIDPARPYCTDDQASELGSRFSCVPDPLGQACTVPTECPAMRPLCVDEHCVECETSPDCGAAHPVCFEETHLCGPCTIDDDCAGRPDAPLCQTSDGACVGCRDAGDCSAGAPVCDVDTSACRGCRADADCPSAVCDRDSGSCIAESSVIYLATSGSAGTCTRDEPCDTFAAGLAQVDGSRNVIKAAPGIYGGQIAITGIAVRIYGEGATVRPLSTGQDAVTITSGADVALAGLTITGAGGGGGTPVGLRCTNATVRLHRSIVIDNDGGVVLTGCEFSLVNNMIALNVSTTNLVGAVYIDQIASAGLHELAFNTVSRNLGAPDSVVGVLCGIVGTPLVFRNNIVFGNTAASGTTTQVGGDADCTWTYSDVGPQGVTGTGNINVDPMFVEPSNGDLHLMPTSDAIDAADPAAELTIDLDGQARPSGTARDMGADEVVSN